MLCGEKSRDIKLLLRPTIVKQSFGIRKDFFLKFWLTEVGEALYNKEGVFKIVIPGWLTRLHRVHRCEDQLVSDRPKSPNPLLRRRPLDKLRTCLAE